MCEGLMNLPFFPILKVSGWQTFRMYCHFSSALQARPGDMDMRITTFEMKEGRRKSRGPSGSHREDEPQRAGPELEERRAGSRCEEECREGARPVRAEQLRACTQLRHPAARLTPSVFPAHMGWAKVGLLLSRRNTEVILVVLFIC